MTQYQNHHQPTAHPAQGTLKATIVAEPRPHHAYGSDRPGQDRQARTVVLAPVRGNGAAGLAAGDAARPVRRVGIMGAGTAGMDIAMQLLEADIPVTVFELARESLDQATASVRSHYQDLFVDGDLAAHQRDRRVALLAGTVNLHHLKDCDVIVDALDVDMGIKGRVLRRLNEVARHDAVLVTCMSNAAVDQVAGLARFPGNVLGLRVLNGESALQTWEFVSGKATSGQALATATALVRNLCKPPEGGAARPN